MKVNQPYKKAPHGRHSGKTMVPLEMHRAVVRLGLTNAETAALLGIAVGTVDELKQLGGALRPDLLERVRVRLAELAQKEAV